MSKHTEALSKLLDDALLADMLVAVEHGYRYAEKGHSLAKAESDLRKMMRRQRDKSKRG